MCEMTLMKMPYATTTRPKVCKPVVVFMITGEVS